jgi:hypothetical protein
MKAMMYMFYALNIIIQSGNSFKVNIVRNINNLRMLNSDSKKSNEPELFSTEDNLRQQRQNDSPSRKNS